MKIIGNSSCIYSSVVARLGFNVLIYSTMGNTHYQTFRSALIVSKTMENPRALLSLCNTLPTRVLYIPGRLGVLFF